MNTITFNLSWLIYAGIALFVVIMLVIQACRKKKKRLPKDVLVPAFYKTPDGKYVNLMSVYNVSESLKATRLGEETQIVVNAYPNETFTLHNDKAKEFVELYLKHIS